MSSDSPQTKKKVKKAAPFAGQRSSPNILVAGTPGVGKTTLCQKLCRKVESLKHVNVGDFAKENDCLEEWDDELQCHVLDEDKIVDELEDLVASGGLVIDHHVTDFFPERWFDIVFVLRTDNTTLYDRLTARGYEGKKLDNNMECEIFQTILDEAKSSYREEIVHELLSNTEEDIDANVDRISAWIEQWLKDNQKQ